MVTTTPSVVFTRREELDRLERALDKLKGEHRQVILLAKIEGLSYQHIGRRLNRSPEAVGMLLSRAMLALIKAFERI
jgi:RNA polymerase sigma factor (sigma-70 family)